MVASQPHNQIPNVINGVDVGKLREVISAIQENPELAKFEFRAKNSWLGGDRSCTTIKEFIGACETQRQGGAGFQALSGEPQVLLGEDKSPNPVEWLLHSLAGCMTTSLAYHSASRGISVDAIDTQIAGDIDLRGFLGISDEVRKGCSNIRVVMQVQSDASPTALKALAKLSPIYDVVVRSVPIDVSVATY